MQAPHEDVADRVSQLKAELTRTDSEWDREKLQERLAKLSGGIGVIKVGAATEVELKERKAPHRRCSLLHPRCPRRGNRCRRRHRTG